MKFQSLRLALPVLAIAALPVAAHADSRMFSSEEAARAACGADEVVWANLSQSKFYHKTQPEFGQSGGAFVCAKGARAHGYREAKAAQPTEAPVGVANR
jgi:hypothetical protein